MGTSVRVTSYVLPMQAPVMAALATFGGHFRSEPPLPIRVDLSPQPLSHLPALVWSFVTGQEWPM